MSEQQAAEYYCGGGMTDIGSHHAPHWSPQATGKGTPPRWCCGEPNGGRSRTANYVPTAEALAAVREEYGHVHREGDRCSTACPTPSGGWRVFPAEWPQDAAAVTDALIAARAAVVEARRAIQYASDLIGSADLARPVRDAEGCMTAALVVLYPKVAEWRGTYHNRVAIDHVWPVRDTSADASGGSHD